MSTTKRLVGLIYKLTDRAVADYVDMGFGIEQRFERCRPYWEKHLEASKDFERMCVEVPPNGETLAVLGAGRLLDLDMPSMTSVFKTVSFFDADPSVQPHWQQAQEKYDKHQIQCHRVELTGCIKEWTTQLEKLLKGKPDVSKLCQFLSQRQPNLDYNPVGPHGTVLSLNLIGQIPIYWRNRVYSLVHKRWGLNPDIPQHYPPQLEQALIDSMRVLELHHLSLLSSCAQEKIILIGDTVYCYHRNREPFSELAALHFDFQNLKLEGFHLRLQDSWAWEISPQGIEQNDFGITHFVRAWEFVRNGQS